MALLWAPWKRLLYIRTKLEPRASMAFWIWETLWLKAIPWLLQAVGNDTWLRKFYGIIDIRTTDEECLITHKNLRDDNIYWTKQTHIQGEMSLASFYRLLEPFEQIQSALLCNRWPIGHGWTHLRFGALCAALGDRRPNAVRSVCHGAMPSTRKKGIVLRICYVSAIFITFFLFGDNDSEFMGRMISYFCKC